MITITIITFNIKIIFNRVPKLPIYQYKTNHLCTFQVTCMAMMCCSTNAIANTGLTLRKHLIL